ncbi:MAG TPA: glycosyltransferase [Acidobacteriaceae bacterium]|nr:glycosyltransferase [Acidobacteriaceae bacterium]
MTTQPFSSKDIPRVTVIMAVNRVDEYLRPAIESILQQTFHEFDFLIIVDAACRPLKEEVNRIGAGDRRIRILEAPSLGGLAFALNMGIAEARGEYIARMDGDDVSRPDRLQEQVGYMDAHQEVAVLGCRVQLINAKSEKVNRQYPYFQSDKAIRRVLPFRNPLPHPALMFRKSALYSVHGYKYGHTSEDHEMFIRMARNPEIKFCNMDKLLFDYRRHDRQGTRLGPRTRVCYVEISGFLFVEFLSTHSPKYLLGMFIIHPWVRQIRMIIRKCMEGSTD